MTITGDRRRRAIMLALVLAAAAGGAGWLRARSNSPGNEVARGVDRDVGAPSVASQLRTRLPSDVPTLPDLPRPGEEERILPEGWDVFVRSPPAESVTLPMPAAGQEAAVSAYRFEPDRQPQAAGPPNPFVPPKQHLAEEDLRAGL